ncbi:heterokaryon incompatibility protein-domain-containing protein [Lasiosphaeria ovina]|uniref:Heterokaryon incompatibility protein-domain-containing protein n=1 Tax=Lasiosphaeria ovina TaxID=92902 RepID=A0AAE0KA67_9PEZI|nr:heterokaryon incompatibility protein-domain-containing protein [Lasiosphaeria ovina]
MRLLKTDTLELVEFVGRPPPYVVLSHTWGADEVTLQDLSAGSGSRAAARKKAGYGKLAGCCARAVADGYDYAWVDTCCIDKTSSAELSEAINSMYRWYHEAHICYAYMSDVSQVPPLSPTSDTLSPTPAAGPGPPKSPRPAFRTIPSIVREYDKLPRTFEHSRWFSRGWTLQELVAPPLVEFYSHDWRELGTKFSLRRALSRITGIDVRVLEGADPATCTVAERMSWAAGRQTTRGEDAAYCLLGVFKVHMPLLYGEGRSRAFFRLQDEIMKTAEDYTMLAWGLSKFLSNKHHWKGVARASGSRGASPRRPLAHGPDDFELHNRALWTYSSLVPDTSSSAAPDDDAEDMPPLMTSRGLRLSLLLRPANTKHAHSDDVHAYINCKTHKPGSGPPTATPATAANTAEVLFPVCLVLRRQRGGNVYTGSDDANAPFVLLDSARELSDGRFARKTVYVLSSAADDDTEADIDALHARNHRLRSLDKNLYILEKPPAHPSTSSLRGLGITSLPLNPTTMETATIPRAWKITSPFSHAVGAGRGHTHYEVPRKFSSATLHQPFDVPAHTARLFAFEPLPSPSPTSTSNPSPSQAEAFAIAVGRGWCDVYPLNAPAFRSRWGVLVRDGAWSEQRALKFLGYLAQLEVVSSSAGSVVENSGGGVGGEAVDRVARLCGDLLVSVALKKARMGDVNCESAVRILWSVAVAGAGVGDG